ncbi:hypothetical protein DFJ73DRAFT_762219 [Zopfochytrium polystomum]|nr:hypothetical protein DFJ73DRAFT_762219 [Zopfochytrium polystomum]
MSGLSAHHVAHSAMGNCLADMRILQIQTKLETLLVLVAALTASEVGTGTIHTVQLGGAWTGHTLCKEKHCAYSTVQISGSRVLKPAALSQVWAGCLKMARPAGVGFQGPDGFFSLTLSQMS